MLFLIAFAFGNTLYWRFSFIKETVSFFFENIAGEGCPSARHNLKTKNNKTLEWSFSSINDETKPSAAKESVEQ